MQTTAIRTVANSLPENEVILLTLLISKRYIPYTDFQKDFGINQQMEVRWKAFMRKITKATDLSFSEVVAFIQETLRPYWENIPHE